MSACNDPYEARHQRLRPRIVVDVNLAATPDAPTSHKGRQQLDTRPGIATEAHRLPLYTGHTQPVTNQPVAKAVSSPAQHPKLIPVYQ